MTSNGLKIVDWGYSISSLNLFDLGYVQSLALEAEEAAWWNIQPGEAQFVLQAYFAACGMEPFDFLPIHRAVMLWGELWSLYNCAQNHLEAEAAGRRANIGILLNAS